MVRFDFVSDFIVPLKWRQNRWSRFRPRTWWLVDPQEDCRVVLGNRPPLRSITQQNTAFLPRIDKSCPTSGPRSSYNISSPVNREEYTSAKHTPFRLKRTQKSNRSYHTPFYVGKWLKNEVERNRKAEIGKAKFQAVGVTCRVTARLLQA